MSATTQLVSAKNGQPTCRRRLGRCLLDQWSLWPACSSRAVSFVVKGCEHALSLLRCTCRASHPTPRAQSCGVACVGVLLDTSSQLQLLIFMGLDAAGFFVVACLKPFANR